VITSTGGVTKNGIGPSLLCFIYIPRKVSVVMLSEGYLKYGFIICGNDVRTLIVDQLGVLKFCQN